MHHIIMADPAEGRAQKDIGAWSETKKKLGILMIITEPDSPVSRGTFLVCSRKVQPWKFFKEQCMVLPLTSGAHSDNTAWPAVPLMPVNKWEHIENQKTGIQRDLLSSCLCKWKSLLTLITSEPPAADKNGPLISAKGRRRFETWVCSSKVF